jgi:hypothetical protein
MKRAARTLGWIGLSCLAAAIGCEDDQALWGDAMSPTQMQRAEMGPGPNPPMMATSGGDSEDPFVDNASYPFVAGPWWSNPAYNGG